MTNSSVFFEPSLLVESQHSLRLGARVRAVARFKEAGSQGFRVSLCLVWVPTLHEYYVLMSLGSRARETLFGQSADTKHAFKTKVLAGTTS